MSIIAPPPTTHTPTHLHARPHSHTHRPPLVRTHSGSPDRADGDHTYGPDSAALASLSGAGLSFASSSRASPPSTIFAASGAATSYAELPPSLAQPALPVPFPQYTQRHTSPYPMSFSSLGTNSASDSAHTHGPITPEHSPFLPTHGLPLHASQPPTAPKVELNDLPILSPDLGSSPETDPISAPIQIYDYAHPNMPTPVLVQAHPQAIRARPSFRVLRPKTSVNGKLVPDTMVKLAPPADELLDLAFRQPSPHLQASMETQDRDTVEEVYEELHRRTAGASLDLDVGSGRGIEGAQSLVLPPPPSAEPISGQGLDDGAHGSTAVVGRSRSDGNKKSSNRKSMGPPPRPKRASTAYPGQLPTSASIQTANIETRQRARHSMVGLPPRTHTYHSQPGSAHSTVSRGIDVSAPSRPFSLVGAAHANAAPDEAAPDLGGPEGLEAKVVLLGSQGAGKTSLILRYTTRSFSANSAPATIGSSLHTRKLVHEGTRVKLQIWDTAGQERFRSMAPIYYRGAHVCVLVYDITDRQSFEDVRSWLEELGRTVPKETVIYVVGAKTDLEGSQRVVSFEEARRNIRLWTRPPSPPMRDDKPAVAAPPHPRSLFRSPSVSAGSEHPSASVTPTRSYSHTALASYDQSTRSLPTSAAGTPARHPSVEQRGRPAQSSTKTKGVRPVLTSPTSPRGVHFPALQSPTRSTQATTTEHVQPSIASASPTGTRHGASSGRYSISGILGMSRTESMSGAALNLARLAEENPTDPQRRSGSPLNGVRGFPASRPPIGGTRIRIESSPLLSSPPAVSARRRSEEWSARSWRMGEGPSAAEALGEFGAGVRRRESGELLSRSNGSAGSGASLNAAALASMSSGYGASGGTGYGQAQSLGSASGASTSGSVYGGTASHTHTAHGHGLGHGYAQGQSQGTHSAVSTPGTTGIAYPYSSGGASTPGSVKAGRAGGSGQGAGGVGGGAGSVGRSRSRGGSLGSASRLNFSENEFEYEEEWGVDIGGIRLGECSALTGDGVEALFKSISSLLVQKKDKIERERTMRKKGSVMLADMDGEGDAGAGPKAGRGRGNCCI